MKVGILTVPFNNNYGGYLQAFALMTVLRRIGHEPSLIMRRHNKRPLTWKTGVKYFIKGVGHSIANTKLCPLIYNVERDYNYIGSNMHRFVDKWIQPQTPYLYSTDELQKYCEGRFDAYVVGSDQVWRAIYVPCIGNYFLDFTFHWNVRRIAYAASFGIDRPEYTQAEINICRQLVPKFDSISFRESNGQKIFEEFGWSDANYQMVLDPTMLLYASDYEEFLPKQGKNDRSHIFYYVLDKTQEITKVLDDIHQILKIPLCGISNIQSGYKPLPSIESWLFDINSANFIVTDSFHGMVFSILFHKPFVVIVNGKRGAERFLNLLTLLNLDERLLTSIDNLKVILEKNINWEIVDTKLNLLREKSLEFLTNSLASNE